MGTEFAILIVHYGRAQTTAECVKSIYEVYKENETSPFILVVDNDSLANPIASHIQFYPSVKVITLNRNVGFGEANNIGHRWIYENERFEHLIFLNNDTVIFDESLTRLSHVLRDSHPSVIATVPKIVFMHDPEEVWCGLGKLNAVNLDPAVKLQIGSDIKDKPVDTDFGSGCCMCIRMRDRIFSNGVFLSALFLYEEDVELCWRFKKAGRNILYIDFAVVKHSVGLASKVKGEEKLYGLDPRRERFSEILYYRVRNKILVNHIHLNSFKRCVFWFFYLPKLFRIFLRCLLVGRARVFFLTVKNSILDSRSILASSDTVYSLPPQRIGLPGKDNQY